MLAFAAPDLFRPLLISALALFLVAALPAWAQGSAPARKAAASPFVPSGPSWAALTPAQRTALAPLEREWGEIDADRKEKWLEIAARFPRMPADERQRVQQRMTEWSRLSPKERGEARLHYQEVRQLSPAERQARWEQYRALPPDQRRNLATRTEPASAAERPDRSSRAGGGATPKSNIVDPTPRSADSAKPVAPTVVQAKPGATTNLMSRTPAPPRHQQPGLPKVAATPGFVDKTTLLPQRGAQAAGTRAPAPASAASAPRRR